MIKPLPFIELGSLLTPAQNILVTLPKNLTFDQTAAGLALFLSLQKTGKQVSVLASDQMTVDFSHLVGVDKVTSELGGQDLVLALDVPIESIEKVSSNEDGGKLNLVIQTKPNYPPLSREKVVFSSARATGDLIFVVGASKLEDLGQIYEENVALLRVKPIVNIDCRADNNQFGHLNFIDPGASSCSEIVVSLIENLGLPVDEDIGGNLLLGLERATDNFQNPLVTARTFEAAAFCLRAGARKNEVNSSVPSPDWLEPKIYKGSTLP